MQRRTFDYRTMAVSRRSSVGFLFAVVLLYVVTSAARGASYDHVNVGFVASALGAVDSNGLFLYSQNETFALGFCVTTAAADLDSYYLCILHAPSQVHTWYANRNNPVRRTDGLEFKKDGSVEIETSSGELIWSTGVGGGTTLQMQETGNLVLFDGSKKILWQSFEHPTDTLLSGQVLDSKKQLVASKSDIDVSEGSFYMSMGDSGLALYNNFTTPQLYWTMAHDGKTTAVNGGVAAYAEIASNVLQMVESDGTTIVAEIILDSSVVPSIRRATLRPDGNLVVYTYIQVQGIWSPAYTALKDACDLPTYCGEYGICGTGGQCSCPDFLVPKNSTDSSQGCVVFSTGLCNDTAPNGTESLAPLPNVNYYGNTFAPPEKSVSEEACQDMCRGNCSCVAAFFHNSTGVCFLWDELGTLTSDYSNNNFVAFLKVPDTELQNHSKHPQPQQKLTVSVIVVVTAIIIVGLLIGALYIHRKRRSRQALTHDDEDDLLDSIPGLPTRFSYKELEAVTNGFTQKLGSGGFGAVYEGLLGDGSKVAVKRLEGVGQGKKEFWAEVATIGSIHHVHLVQLRGFCAEGAHRLLVYEFMANGSLEKILFSTSKDARKDELVLDWNTRVKISVATARGLAYLHEDCRERIIHCDIKPENILLDDNLVAKVSDFGLAKLMNPEQSEVFTTMRGTRGYLAPEWLLNSPISDRSDVYSFGMVLLEIISGRKNFDATVSSEKMYYPMYAFHQIEIGNSQALADSRLKGNADEEQVANLIRIALWCIQDEVARRPTMKKIIKMLDGMVEVPQPPMTPQLAYRLHGGKFDSGNDSGISDFDSGGMSASRLSGPR